MKILAVDDHPLFRKGLVGLIEDAFPDSNIMEAQDGLEASKLLKSDTPELAILDIDMPEKSGIELLDFIKENTPDVLAIILTMHNDEVFFNEALNKGAKGFLLKEDSSGEIIECMESVQAGKIFVSKRLRPFLENRTSFNKELKVIKEALESLTNSEFKTLQLVSQNKTSKEIAELLFVTEKSVENYRSRICKKLDISGGSNSLYKWCIQHKEYIK